MRKTSLKVFMKSQILKCKDCKYYDKSYQFIVGYKVLRSFCAFFREVKDLAGLPCVDFKENNQAKKEEYNYE